MSQEDAGAPLVEAPNQSAARAESVAEGFANYLYQRDLKQIEEQSLFQKRLAERHREDIVNVVKLLLNNQENVPSTATSLSAVTSASVQAQLEAIPSALPVPQNIINLNELSANPKVPFQSTRSLGGALEILNISCTEEKCPWRGPKEQYTEHLRRQHKLKPYRCLQLGCNRIFSFQ